MKFSAKLLLAISSQKIQIYLCNKNGRYKNCHRFLKLETSYKVLTSRFPVINRNADITSLVGYQPKHQPGINRMLYGRVSTEGAKYHGGASPPGIVKGIRPRQGRGVNLALTRTSINEVARYGVQAGRLQSWPKFFIFYFF
jgi:hypothetical protein